MMTPAPLVLLLLLVACSDPDPPDGDPADDSGTNDTGPSDPIDADSDGYTVDDDCDDTDSSVHPGADEICNGIDDDCNDLIDDADPDLDLDTASTWYEDSDGDGFGDPDSAVAACDAPEGMIANGSDCDDGDSTVNPDAAEVCDGVDQDCDGDVDETCDPAPEGAHDLSEYDLRFEGEPGARLGYSIAGTGDVDGDGTNDILVSGISEVDGKEDAGAAWVLRGPLTTGERLVPESATITGEEDNQALGWPVASAGDLDDDGLNDLLMVNYGDGQAVVVYGPATGTRGVFEADAVVMVADYPRPIAIAGVGDVTGDGVDDMLIGDKGNHTSGDHFSHAQVFAGPLWGELNGDAAAATLYTAFNYDHIGISVAGVGDISGDGISDVATLHNYTVYSVYVQFGPLDGDVLMDHDFDVNLTGAYYGGPSAGMVAPWAPWMTTADADADGDGRADLLIGGWIHDGDNSGSAYLITRDLTGTSTLASADVVFSGENASDGASFVAWAGDLDQDGHADISIGAPGYDDDSLEDAGAVYIIYGPMTGTIDLADADAIITGDSADANAGYAVVGAGDVNGDIYPDLVVSAPYETLGGTADGVLWVIPGGP